MKTFFLLSDRTVNLQADGLKQLASAQTTRLAEDAAQAVAWVIDMRDPQQGWHTLCEVRADLNPAVYLKPALMLHDQTPVPAHMQAAFDGTLEQDKNGQQLLEDFAARFLPINQWINRLKPGQDTNLAFKTLRWIASRNQPLTPMRTTAYKTGFVYPPLLPLFEGQDSGALETLSFLTQQSLLSTEFYSKSHFCIHCDSAFLNFKECCPQCSSDDIEVQELIHHFKCAYTAPEGTFRRADQLVCPKCDRELRHIGVDYDKPSSVCQCNQCNFSFQDAEVMTECFSCGRTTEHAQQRLERIYCYQASAIGFNAARHGLDELFSRQLESRLTLLPESAFRSFFNIEQARIERYKRSRSSLAMVRFTGLDNLYTRSGSRAPQIFAELSQIFRSVFRESDVITARNESVFFIIMTETDQDSAYIGLQRLEDAVQSLFSNNLQADLVVNVRAAAITAQTGLDTLLEDFLQEQRP